MRHDPGCEHECLGALVGRWKTEGWTSEAPPVTASRIEALDTYEWLPGGHALLHRVDAHVGDQRVEGAEIIGYDPTRRTYITQYFGSDGPGAYEASLANEYGALVWTMRNETERSSACSATTATRSWATGSCSTMTRASGPGWTSR